MNLKQKKIKIEPRIKLNYNIYATKDYLVDFGRMPVYAFTTTKLQ